MKLEDIYRSKGWQDMVARLSGIADKKGQSINGGIFDLVSGALF